MTDDPNNGEISVSRRAVLRGACRGGTFAGHCLAHGTSHCSDQDAPDHSQLPTHAKGSGSLWHVQIFPSSIFMQLC